MQNDRTEHTDSAKKNGNVLACLRAEIFVELCQDMNVDKAVVKQNKSKTI